MVFLWGEVLIRRTNGARLSRAQKSLRAAACAAAVSGAFALTLAGAGTASAGTGPNPAPGAQPPASSAPSEVGNPLSAQAAVAGVCSDAYQIGTTSYAYRGAEKIASVKQFYSPSCNENYGYVWVWKSFLDKKIKFDLQVGVWNYDRSVLQGERRWYDSLSQEFWGNGADSVDDCTSGDGTLNIADEPGGYSARTSKRC
ncbi:hypothetical protein [Streptomyces californicus]|uniref:hypothetical protein n=1 Tax=Streptomyces californicus TaxID=67351 RepID=UPI0008924773|nr:hypothetical protein F610DRAFT_03672 [Streptomyces sp. LaPpAH-199]